MFGAHPSHAAGVGEEALRLRFCPVRLTSLLAQVPWQRARVFSGICKRYYFVTHMLLEKPQTSAHCHVACEGVSKVYRLAHQRDAGSTAVQGRSDAMCGFQAGVFGQHLTACKCLSTRSA